MSAYPSPIVALSWTSASGQTVDLQGDPLGIRVNLTEGMDGLPVIRVTDDVVPFRAGRLRSLGIADRRPIVLEGYVKTPDDTTYRGIVAPLQRALDPTVGAGTLTATAEHGGVRTISAVPLNIVYSGRLRTGRSLSIELDADPFWRGATWGTAWTADMGLLSDDGLSADMTGGLPITITPIVSPYTQRVAALGTTDTLDAVVEVDGPTSGAVTVQNASGVGFTHPALSGGQTLIVDAGLRTATIAGVSVRSALTLLAANVHGEFFRLAPGLTSVTVTGLPAAVRIIHDPTYL